MLQNSFIVIGGKVVRVAVSFGVQILIAALFGASIEMDSYAMAIGVPLAIVMTIFSSVSPIIIPQFMELKERHNEETAWQYGNTMSLLILGGSFTITLGLIVFSESIVAVIAPGFSEAVMNRTVTLLKWSSLIVVLNAGILLFTSFHHCYSNFLLPALIPSIMPLGMGIGVLMWGAHKGTLAIIQGQIIGAISAWIILIGFMTKKQVSGKLLMKISDPYLRKAIRLWFPLMLGVTLHGCLPMLERYFASQLSVGRISHLNYAYRLAASTINLIGPGIGVAIFPQISGFASKNQWEQVKQTVSQGVRMVLIVMIPLVVAGYVFTYPMLTFVFVRGKFLPEDAKQVALVLPLYIMGFGISSLFHIINKCFFILKDTKTPFLVGLMGGGLYIAVAVVLLPFFGFIALAIAFLAYWGGNVLTNGVIARYKFGNTGGKKIINTLCKALGASVVSAVIASLLLSAAPVNGFILISSLLVYGVMYGICSEKIFKIEEMQAIKVYVVMKFLGSMRQK